MEEIINKAKDKAFLKNTIAKIKQNIKDKIPIESADIEAIKELAAKYPNDPDIQRIILEAQDLIKTSLKEVTNIISAPHEDKNKSYTEEKYNELLTKENNYFDSKKTQKRYEFINKIMSGSHINDDDKSGNSISSEQFINFIQDISSNEEKAKAREASELFSYDLSKLKEKEASGNTLSKEENLRKEQILERCEKRAQELLYESIFKNHQKNYAEANNKEPQETTIEEVVKASGNKIIDKVIEFYPELKEAFKGIEEKLVALLFHNPEAIHKHHNNLEQLKAEADKSYQYQKEYEKERSKQLKVKEAHKSSTKVGTKEEKETKASFKNKVEENQDIDRIKNNTSDLSLIETIIARNSLSHKLPTPTKTLLNNSTTASPSFIPTKPKSKPSGPSR